MSEIEVHKPALTKQINVIVPSDMGSKSLFTPLVIIAFALASLAASTFWISFDLTELINLVKAGWFRS